MGGDDGVALLLQPVDLVDRGLKRGYLLRR
jgi:hypothetical protein